MKRPTKMTTALSALLLLMSLSSCGSNNAIVGKWEASLDDALITIEFVSGGTYTSTNQYGNVEEGTYTIRENRITINQIKLPEEPSEGRYTATYSYKTSDKELTLTDDDNNSIVFIRK